VTLIEPNIAYIKHSPDSEKTQIGHWTLVYDQGIVVQFDKYRFITNWRYNVKNESLMQAETLDFNQIKDFESQCDQTMVGTMQRRDKGGLWSGDDTSCFYGQHTSQPTEETEEEDNHGDKPLVVY
jgi:hypothetical protein